MANITFVTYAGKEYVVDIEEGKTLMQTAIDNGVPGIDADCGGSCACGTCHVILEKRWLAVVGGASASELQMLDMSAEKTDFSRLSCQVSVSDALDGMVVHLPEFQV